MSHPLEPAFRLIHEFEGCSLRPYLDPIGLPTVGWGHLILPAERGRFGVVDHGRGAKPRFSLRDPEGHALTQEQADLLFAYDANVRIVQLQLEFFDAGVRLSALQFGAILAWYFNLGQTNWRTSTLRKVVLNEEHENVPYQIMRWNKAGGRVFAGLTRRRRAEADMYIAGTE